jgi:hypothetical protein
MLGNRNFIRTVIGVVSIGVLFGSATLAQTPPPQPAQQTLPQPVPGPPDPQLRVVVTFRAYG